MFWPVQLFLLWQSSQHPNQGLVHPFTTAVAHGMERSSPRLLDPEQTAEFLDDLRLEIRPLIRMETFRNSKALNEAKKSFCRGLGRHVSGWDGFGKASEMIGDDQYILCTTL